MGCVSLGWRHASQFHCLWLVSFKHQAKVSLWAGTAVNLFGKVIAEFSGYTGEQVIESGHAASVADRVRSGMGT